MVIDRRTFLALSATVALQGSRFSGSATAGEIAAESAAAAPDEPLFLGARLSGARYEVAVIDAQGRDRLVLPIEGRGHSFAIDRVNGVCVAFARSPGQFAIVFSPRGVREPLAITPARGRHFFGHGVFTPDGRLMLATENDYEAGRGVTGIYDATDGFRRIGEFPSDGIGPHELLLMRDGRTICIANGGILTHPDYPRQKLNLTTMRASLVYCDIETGDVVEKAGLKPGLERLSIRHMALDREGAVWFGCQYEGALGDQPPLVGRHKRGGELELFSGPEATLRQMRGYVGSVATDLSGDVLATSSPKGGLIVYWDTATGRYLGERALPDGCGVAPQSAGVTLATSGRGAIIEAGPQERRVLKGEDASAPAWDNHLRRI